MATAPDPVAVPPIPMLLVLEAEATGPMAIEFVPVAAESARVELAWKYLIPAPVTYRPVESDATPLWTVLIPLEAEVESELMLLMSVLATE